VVVVFEGIRLSAPSSPAAASVIRFDKNSLLFYIADLHCSWSLGACARRSRAEEALGSASDAAGTEPIGPSRRGKATKIRLSLN